MNQQIKIEGTDDQPICPYLPLPKLLRLITESSLFFPKLNLFQRDDPYECTLLPEARYANKSDSDIRFFAAMLANFHAFEPTSSMEERAITLRHVRHEIETADIDSVRELLKTLEAREWADGVICNCWHLSAEESDAMWKIYSGRTGAAVFSTVKQLAAGVIGFVESDDYERNTNWIIAPVQYCDEKDLKEVSAFYVEHPWLLKRKAFAHEKELRLFKSLPGGSRKGFGREIRLDTEAIVNKIVLSPLNAKWENDAIEIALKKLCERNFKSVPPIEVSRHLTAEQTQGKILSKVSEIKRREDDLLIQKSLMQLPTKLLMRGRSKHTSDEQWILSVKDDLLRIWDEMPNGIAQVVLLEEFMSILKFTRIQNVAGEATIKLQDVRAKIFASNPMGEKVDSVGLAEVAKFLDENLK